MNRSVDEGTVRAARREQAAIPAPVWLRLLYSATLVAMVFPLGVAGMSGWVGLTLGTSLIGSLLLPLLAIVVWRVYVVWRHPTTLVRHRAGALIGVLRGIAVVEMVIGCLAALALLLQRPIIEALGGVRTESGIEYFVLQLGAVLIGGLGYQGIAIFEWTRLIGLERFYRDAAPEELPERESPAVVWLGAIGILLTLLPIVLLAGVLLRLSGGLVASLIGLLAAIPMLTLMVLRVGGLIRHRHAVPRPATAGLLGVLRNVAIVGLGVGLIAELIGVGLLVAGPGWHSGAAALLLAKLTPLMVFALEASRLFAYERHERSGVQA